MSEFVNDLIYYTSVSIVGHIIYVALSHTVWT